LGPDDHAFTLCISAEFAGSFVVENKVVLGTLSVLLDFITVVSATVDVEVVVVCSPTRVVGLVVVPR